MNKIKDTLLYMAEQKEVFEIGNKKFQIIEVKEAEQPQPEYSHLVGKWVKCVIGGIDKTRDKYYQVIEVTNNQIRIKDNYEIQNWSSSGLVQDYFDLTNPSDTNPDEVTTGTKSCLFNQLINKMNTMKNIHLLPTDKPSRLHLIEDTLTITSEYKNSVCDAEVNIYITSEETIKKGDWYFDDANQVRKAIMGDGLYWAVRNGYKKIILTTDQDLIKDGVQAIDDEFLEWFVKNPSCEEVDVKEKQHFEADKSKRYNPLNGVFYTYNIIIPKEEPKQKTMSKQTAVEWLFERLERMIPRTALYNIDKKQYFNQAKAMEREQKEYFFNCGRQYQLTGEGTFTEVYNETYKGGEE